MKIVSKIWKYFKWVFPPYLIWRFILCPIWRVVTWPFRRIISLFQRDSERWAANQLAKMKAKGMRRPYTIGAFTPVWRDKQNGRSYIDKSTIQEVADRNGLTYRQLVRIMCSGRYEWHFNIIHWDKITQELGFTDYKQHRSLTDDVTRLTCLS